MRRKRIRIEVCCCILLMCLFLSSGCGTVNVVDDDVYYSLNDFRDKEIVRLIDYIEQDQNLSIRDKNTFRTKLENFDESLGRLKGKN